MKRVVFVVAFLITAGFFVFVSLSAYATTESATYNASISLASPASFGCPVTYWTYTSLDAAEQGIEQCEQYKTARMEPCETGGAYYHLRVQPQPWRAVPGNGNYWPYAYGGYYYLNNEQAECPPYDSWRYNGVIALVPTCPSGGVFDKNFLGYCMIPYTCSNGLPPDSVTGLCEPPAERSIGTCPCQNTPHPIDLGSGNEHEEFTDYRSGGPFPLTFTRTYNSALANQGASPDGAVENVGVGWSSNVRGHLYARSIALPSPAMPPGPCIDPDTHVAYFCPPGGYSSTVPYEVEATVWHADGSQGLFRYFDDGTAPPPAGAQLINEAGTDGQLFYVTLPTPATGTGYKYVRNDGDTELYDGNGKLLSVTNPDGLSHTYSYDASGNLTAITDSFGHQLSFSYDSRNLVNRMTTPDGRVYTYDYDTKYNLISVHYPDNTTVHYLYENTGIPHALTGFIDAAGNRYATWSYDSHGRAYASHLAGNADAVSIAYSSDGSTDVTEANGLVRHMQFTTINYKNLMTGVSAPCPECGDTSKSITYDANGFISSTTDFDGNVTDYTHDASGLELSRTEGAGTQDQRTIITQWDTSLRKPMQISEPGRTTAYTYDDVGRMLTKTVTDIATNVSRTTTYSYNSTGLLESVTDPLGHATQFAYDTQGNLASIANALGQVTQVTQYDANGYPLTIIDPNGVETGLAYDACQRLISRTVAGATTKFVYDPVGNLIKVTLPTGAYLQYQYDAAHRLTGVSDNLGDSITYTLDALGNRTETDTKDPPGAVTRTLKRVYNSLNQLQQLIGGAGQATTYTNDLNGNPTAIADPMGNVTHQVFDRLNRLVTVVDPANGNTTYNHDALDQVTDVADPKGLDTHYTYDAFGDVLTQVSPDTGTTTFTYDLDGNRLTKKDAKGVTAIYTYDALNRLTGISYPDSVENVMYSYDQGINGIGRLTAIADQSGSTAYQYDEHGNVTGKTTTVDGHTFAIAYQYDAADELTGMTYPDGVQVAYVRDAAERITSVTVTRNGVSQTVASGIGYEPFGPLSGLTYGNGLTESRTYDQDYRLTAISVPGIEQWTLADNADDDITTITDTLNTANSQVFGYDALNRLTSAQGFYGTLGYNYDLDGNRTGLSTNGTAASYNYDTASNRLLTAGTASYQYDADGNLINDGPHTYSYNDANRLTGYDSQAGVYLYNGLSQRVRKPSPVTPGDANGDGVIDQNDLHSLQDALKGQAPIAPGMDCNQDGVVNNKDKSCIATQIGSYKNQGKGKNSTTTTAAATTGTSSLYIYFAYDEAGHLIGEYDQNGNLIEEHIWLGNRPLAVATANAIDYITTDQLDTPRAITDSNKALVWSWDSDPFGNGDANTNPSGLGLFTYNLRFPGQYYDAETWHNYNYSRDYDPTTGRYVESDPIGLRGGINTYTYVHENPASHFDQKGSYDCFYTISSHTMFCEPYDYKNPIFISSNFVSGKGKCQNNPDCVSKRDFGPLPTGTYKFGDVLPGHSIMRPLIPDITNNMFNRRGFEYHGCTNPEDCSIGCIAAIDNNTRDELAHDLALESGSALIVDP